MGNDELKTLDYFSCLPNHELQYLGPISPNCTNAPNTLKQVKLDLQMALDLSKASIYEK